MRTDVAKLLGRYYEAELRNEVKQSWKNIWHIAFGYDTMGRAKPSLDLPKLLIAYPRTLFSESSHSIHNQV
jgi:hypothetical protein